MNSTQIVTVAGAFLLFLILYLGFDKVPPSGRDLEKSRMLQMESTSVSNLVREASTGMSTEQRSVIEALDLDLRKVGKDTINMLRILETLAGTWYNSGFSAISGNYAEEIAKIQKTEASWSIAGTTYALCLNQNDSEKIRSFCFKRAVNAFERAISIDPDKIEPRINLAVCYTDFPMPEDPMKGIIMLRELNNTYPKNVQVLNQLGRLALKTNQFERAIERLEEAYNIDPTNKNTVCLLADAYKMAGNGVKALDFEKKCLN
jgi:tetratricopeptide (TPR) repeat protein